MYATESTEAPRKSSVGKKLAWTALLGTTAYAGATYAALKNEAFYDTYTTYIPGGEKLLDAIEDALEDDEVKNAFNKVKGVTDQAQKYGTILKEYGVKTKETTMDWYEYISDAIAQFKGEKEAPKMPGSGYSKLPKPKKQQPVFSNVLSSDTPAQVPKFEAVGDKTIDSLAETVQGLVVMLNEAGMNGHAKRLADYASREIESLQKGYKLIQQEQEIVLKSLKELSADTDRASTKLEEHCHNVEEKVQSLRQRSIDRVAEKKEKMKKDFVAETAAMQKELTDIAARELEAQKKEYLAALTKELSERAVEIQRQYIREVRHQVEAERGGKLACIEDVAVKQRTFEQLACENAEQLDDSQKAHKLLVAIDALKRAAYSGNKQAFLEELQALLRISAPSNPFADATEKRNDALVQVVASSISETVARHGISSAAQLTTRFATVAAEVRRASLIPEENSSMISHIISLILSKLMFTKQGLVPGEDIEARLARAEYYLVQEGDLESAAREVNQLTGWPKHLASDWLDAARRHLEIKQALEVSLYITLSCPLPAY